MTYVQQVAHTSALTREELAELHRMLVEAFEGDFTDEDCEHTLGGVHAVVREDGEVVAHGCVVMRRLLHDGRALRTGYVEGVAVRADRRGHGLGSVVMDALEETVRGGYVLGALSATDSARAFYERRGWVPWTGSASVVTPDGTVPTPGEEEALMLLPVDVRLRPDGDLACDWRGGEVW
jgi:aminoglycoside 2'-N-acetyltransferase I